MSAVLSVRPLGSPPWATRDPFLFCVHHNDAYPAGNDLLGPQASLAGRAMGSDFSGLDGWSMYHGRSVPGFPRHPHRGFETISVTRRGYIDHADSLGATARYGQGDVQWMTAGKGIVHAEMFPLVEPNAPNHMEMFQIWLNLPAKSKMVDPYFTMLWAHDVPRRVVDGATITVTAGELDGARPPSPPPESWASQRDSDVFIATIALDPGASWSLPAARTGTNRDLYVFSGGPLAIGGQLVPSGNAVSVRPEQRLLMENRAEPTQILVLQGRPIGEPVVQHGPFVMNTRSEIHQAFTDYHSTGFGGWPWPDDAPVHRRDSGRFARHANGRVEKV